MTSRAARLGLIGLGRWGRVYLKSIAALGDKCVVSHVATSRDDAGALAPGAEVLRRWQNVVLSNCDAVIVATPPDTHADILEGCLHAKKPCMVEKPLCLDAVTAERLHARVTDSGVPVLVDHTQLFNPAYQAMKTAWQASREPIHLLVSESVKFGPFRQHTAAMWDWAPHDLSLCLDLLGRAPRYVDALAGPLDPRGQPELVSIRLDFDGGATAWIHVGRLAPEKRRGLTVYADRHVFRFVDSPELAAGVADFDFLNRESLPSPEALELAALPVALRRKPMEAVVEYFVDGLAGGDRSRFGTALALDIVRTLEQCDIAWRKRRG